MTEATKAAVQEFISNNLMSAGDYRSIHSVDPDGTTVEADGYLHLGDLAEAIEAAERERCATVASGYGWNIETQADGSLIADRIRSRTI